ESPPFLQHKWRSGVLLLTYPAWFTREEQSPKAPWRTVRELRSIQAARGYLGLSDLCHAARLLTEPQLTGLAEEFPALNSLSGWREIFAACDLAPGVRDRMTSRQGIALSDLQQLLPASANPNVRKLLDTPGGRALRIVEKELREAKPPAKVIFVQVLGDD